MDSYQVRKIALDGTLTHFAGTGISGRESGDGGPAAQANIGYASAIAVDSFGSVYLLNEHELTLRKINRQGIISTLFSSGVFSLDRNLTPLGLTVDPSGIIYAEAQSFPSYRNQPFTVYTFTQDGTILNRYPLELEANTSYPWAIDGMGNFFWLDSGHNLNKVTAAGTITAVNLPQIPKYNNLLYLAVDASGNAFIANVSVGSQGISMQEVTSGGKIFTIAPEGTFLPNELGYVSSLVSDASGNLYSADSSDSIVQELTAGCPAAAQPIIAASAVVNAATYDQTLAAGEIATIFGLNLGPATGLSVPVNAGLFPTQYAGVSMSINGYLAPLLYVSQTQVNFVVPFEVEGQRDRYIQISYNGVSSDQYYNPFDGEPDPGIFAIANPDYSQNSATNAVKAGSYVVVYGTGQGVSNSPQIDGMIMGSDNAIPQLPITALIDGQPATVLYAGSAPGLVAGVLQVNLSITVQLTPGKHGLVISAGNWNNSLQAFSLYTQ